MNKRTWVLGASDPEMAVIESLLRECGEAVVHASIDGRRVHPGNAYQADWPEVGEGVVCLVECGFHSPAEDDLANYSDMIRFDHHKPGDIGYGVGPESFLSASSLGQVLAFLAENGLMPGPCGRLQDHGDFSPVPFWNGSAWVHDIAWSAGQWFTVKVARALVLCAAADHCLGAAYRGECPGVSPDALMQWRAASRAAFQGRPAAEVLADVDAARDILRAAGGEVLPWPIEGRVGDGSMSGRVRFAGRSLICGVGMCQSYPRRRRVRISRSWLRSRIGMVAKRWFSRWLRSNWSSGSLRGRLFRGWLICGVIRRGGSLVGIWCRLRHFTRVDSAFVPCCANSI